MDENGLSDEWLIMTIAAHGKSPRLYLRSDFATCLFYNQFHKHKYDMATEIDDMSTEIDDKSYGLIWHGQLHLMLIYIFGKFFKIW